MTPINIEALLTVEQFCRQISFYWTSSYFETLRDPNLLFLFLLLVLFVLIDGIILLFPFTIRTYTKIFIGTQVPKHTFVIKHFIYDWTQLNLHRHSLNDQQAL